MTALGVGRRRGAGLTPSGWRASIPQADLEAHGAGYPVTYRFTVPDVGGLTAQWRRSESAAWSNLPPAPTGRFDGIPAARFDGTTAYASVAFPVDSNEVYMRIVDQSGAEVAATYQDITPHYDNRTAAVAFTYDDNPTVLLQAAAAHADAGLWMSPGLCPGLWLAEPWMDRAGLKDIHRNDVVAAVAGGYVEPANHTLTHQNATKWVDYADATYQVGTAADILGGLQPPQSRGRCLGFYYPNGFHNELAYQVCGEAGHLSARVVDPQGVYVRGAWNETYGLVTNQSPSISPGTYGAPPDLATQQAQADELVPAVNAAKAVGGQCIVYSYIYYWSWGATDPWPTALAQVGAMADVWSVGYGHLALYQRMRERVTVTPASPA